MISGPVGSQTWTVTRSLPFALRILGWGLTDTNSIQIVPNGYACGGVGAIQPSWVIGPTIPTPAVLNGNKILRVIDPYSAGLGINISGSVIVFGYRSGGADVLVPHGLVNGDWIYLSGVIVTGDTEKTTMYNSYFEVQVVDENSVLINVVFASFPVAVDVSGATWIRSSEQLFSSLVVTQPGTYTVCWLSGVGSVPAPAGTLTVTAPPVRPGTVGLSASFPSTTSAASLKFRTTNLPIYSSATHGRSYL
jgi:hypothetical protein